MRVQKCPVSVALLINRKFCENELVFLCMCMCTVDIFCCTVVIFNIFPSTTSMLTFHVKLTLWEPRTLQSMFVLLIEIFCCYVKWKTITGLTAICFLTIKNYLKKIDKLNKHYSFLSIIRKIFNSSNRKCKREVAHVQLCRIKEFWYLILFHQ